MRGSILRATYSIAAWLIVLAVGSFLCGIMMGIVDRVGANDKPGLISYGLSVMMFGMLVFSVPVSVVTGFVSWRNRRA
jgi:hypothetical protein